MPLAGAPGVGAASYEPRAMEGTVLHRVVRENFETFRAEIAARTDGGGLPQFVEREFRDFLTCGALSRGFARVRCEAPDVMRTILGHLGLPTEPPRPLPARPPPGTHDLFPDSPA